MVTLNQGEHSVLATFPSSTKAQKAMEALKDSGFEVVQLDTVSKFPSEPDANYNNPIASQAVSLSSLTLNSEGGSSGDVGPLLAADTAVSGLSTGDDLVGFDSYLITAVVPEERVEEAVATLKQYGGEV